MNQKIHNFGTPHVRYFWNVSSVTATGEKQKTTYRSRHADAKGVKGAFKARGHSNIRVTPAKV